MNPDDPEPAHYTLGPNAFRDGSQTTAWPFLLKVVLCFLVIDEVERIVELTSWVLAQGDALNANVSPYFPKRPLLVLWILVDLLMVTLLALRTLWGRILVQVIFGMHIAYVGLWIALEHPEAWLYMTDLTRVRVLATVVLDLCAIAVLFGPASREFLDR
ncbi:MAG: hypothetical protein KDA28_16210 [Phycisphaerales bacterium]|nr:hypothetical protein [Phycisphaerales bacterium]